MFIRTLSTICILGVAAIVSPAHGQISNSYLETLNSYNDIKPLQNPGWERSQNTLKSRVLDKKNKVVGELEDIILTPRGSIASLNVDLNRLRLGKVHLNYHNLDIQAAPRSYTMSYAEEQIEEITPQLLANIETAAGSTADSISTENLLGSGVFAADGRRIGSVEEIMFSERGERAEAIIIRVNYKTVRGESVAIPFSSPKYTPDGSRFKVNVTNQEADTIIEFADNL